MLDFSVIMAAYNSEMTIKESLLSVLSQSFVNFEIVVVDDCSTDSTLKVIESIDDKRIVLLRNEKNHGPAFSRNVGVKHSSGMFLAILDSDDLMMPDRLCLHREIFLNTNVDIVAGGYSTIDDSGLEINNLRQCPTSHLGISLGLRWGPTFPHSSVSFTKRSFDQVGGYRDLYPGTEDYDLYSRLLLSNFRFAAVAGSVLQYRISPHGISQNNKEKLAQNHLSIADTVQKHKDLPSTREIIRSVVSEPFTTGMKPRRRVTHLLAKTSKEMFLIGRKYQAVRFSLASFIMALTLPIASIAGFCQRIIQAFDRES